MEKTFGYSRKIRVPLDDRGYNSNEYFLSSFITYNEKDLEELTVIDKNEFKELAEELDKVQREIIEKETGITELPMDISKRRIKMKTKFKLKKKYD